jgi:hypothetical protein
MARETDPNRARRSVIAGGALLMVASAVAAFAASELFYRLRPARVWGERDTVLVPFVPLTALTILVAAIIWARLLRPSPIESLFSLLAIEAGALAMVAVLVGELSLITCLFWLVANVMFAPSWVLGLRIGGAGLHQ